MAYKPNFKWTDELVIEFAKLSTLGSYGIFDGMKSIGDKLEQFKKVNAEKQREEKYKRKQVGKRGMNDDGSRFYFDKRAIKWTIKRLYLDSTPNSAYYTAETEKGESIRTKFLDSVYFEIDKYVESEMITKNNFVEILK